MLEYGISVFWSYMMAALILIWFIGKFVEVPYYMAVPTLIPGWNGIVLAVTCLMQFAISMTIDSRYEQGLGKFYYWLIWYPIVYWLLNVSTIVVAVPKALFKKKGARAVWVSPDRGMQAGKPSA